MAPVARNPLEPGVYRVDFAPEHAPVFGRWRRAQKGKVHVLELEQGPGGKARVSFVAFAKPGAFPFGQLGHPEQGQIVGALPDFLDVIGFVTDPLGVVESYLVQEMAKFLADHAQPELQAMRDAIAQTKVNISTIGRELESVRNGTATNPALVLHNAAALVAQSIESLLAAGAHVPIDFARATVNGLLQKLHELGEAIKSAPGKALHAVTEFGKQAFTDVVEPFVIPFNVGLIGLAVFAGAAFLSWEQGKVTDLTRNLMLAGGAVALLGEGALALNIHNLFHSEPAK